MPRKRRPSEDWLSELYEPDDILGARPLRAPSEHPGAPQEAGRDAESPVIPEPEDPAFIEYWRGLEPERVERMVATSAAIDARRGFVEDDASRELRRRCVRANVGRFWLRRKTAREDQDRAVIHARLGYLGKGAEERRAAQIVTEGLDAREPVVPGDEILHSVRFEGIGRYLGYKRACQLRSFGELERAYAIFCKYSDHRHVFPDDPLPLPPRDARAGIVTLNRVNGRLHSGWCIPVVAHFNWDAYDHVVGLGTTITPGILDLLGVPAWKQHIVEVHHQQPFPTGGAFPRLRGRVVVVDDVHEGELSLLVARLYRGDVVNAVGPDFTPLTTALFEAPQPLASIACDAVERIIEAKQMGDE